MISHFRVGLILTISLTLLTGCGDSDFPPTATVTGTVTVDGEPMERLSVNFTLQGEAARGAFGVTDANGRFELSTVGKNDGALLGTHTVTISDLPEQLEEAMDNKDPTALYGKSPGMFGKPTREPERIPRRYANPKTSGLEETVTEEGPNEFTFELNSK